ncbi:MAG: DUF559 domain-containing protein [Chloroflexi bacterium]|nr:DUF559 domain-containing protein [Chloroflexota bacterium]
MIRGFVVDVCCHSARPVVEVDGGVHAAQCEYDAARDDLMAHLGLRVLRVTNDDVQDDLAGVLARISRSAGIELVDADAERGGAGSPLPATGRGPGG